MIISEAKITSKRQITLPVKILHRLKLHPGDPVVFEEKNGHIELMSRSKFTIDDLIKKYKNVSKKRATDEEIRKAREESWSSRFRK